MKWSGLTLIAGLISAGVGLMASRKKPEEKPITPHTANQGEEGPWGYELAGREDREDMYPGAEKYRM